LRADRQTDRQDKANSSLSKFFEFAEECIRYFENVMLGFCVGNCRWRQFQEKCGSVG